MSAIRLGVTATREKLTEKQLSFMWFQINRDEVIELHHGACLGGDESSHHIAMNSGVATTVHPPTNMRFMMDLAPYEDDPRVTILDPKPYRDRNRDIVDESDRIIACPKKSEEQGGGTWYTVHYAVERGRQVIICYPDGKWEIR